MPLAHPCFGGVQKTIRRGRALVHTADTFCRLIRRALGDAHPNRVAIDVGPPIPLRRMGAEEGQEGGLEVCDRPCGRSDGRGKREDDNHARGRLLFNKARHFAQHPFYYPIKPQAKLGGVETVRRHYRGTPDAP